MDISNLAKTGSIPLTATAASAAGESFTIQSSPVTGSSLPDMGQVQAPSDSPLTSNPVSSLSSEELDNLVNQANVTLQSRSSDLKFTVAEGTDISVVRIEDAETGELIRQFPSEEMVAIARALSDAQQGTMFEEKA